MADAAAPTAAALRRGRPPRTGNHGPRIGLSPHLRRLLWLALLGIIALAVLALGVFPTRQYLAQRSDAAQRQATLEQLRAENAKLRAQVDALGTDAEIERIARSEYGFVLPGEETYAVLPPPASGPEIPAVWPFN
jgi:cell division protein FtsB